MPEIYKRYVSPLLDQLDSESWHIRAREALHLAEASPLSLWLLGLFAYQRRRFADRRLQTRLDGIKFENPLVVGAGWDKAGRTVKSWHRLGFAGVEVGSVLAHPQEGNPKPRQFMAGPGVAINRLGFNTPPGGLEEVARNLSRYEDSGIPIGVSIGKNKEVPLAEAAEVHAIVARRLYPNADYFVINVSSPNTPGLRDLQDKGPLTEIVQAVNAAMDEKDRRKPLLVKIAPDLTDTAVDDVIRVVVDNNLTGIVATNTTNNPDIKAKYGRAWRTEMGGLSGDDPDFRSMATHKVAHIYHETKGAVKVIGVGGINSASTALEKIMAGATLIQAVTAIRGEGTAFPSRTTRGLVEYMDREGVRRITELVGVAVNKYL